MEYKANFEELRARETVRSAVIEFSLQYDSLRGIGTGISEVSKRVHIFPLLPSQSSKRVPIFGRGTGSKPERLRSGSLQADLSLIV